MCHILSVQNKNQNEEQPKTVEIANAEHIRELDRRAMEEFSIPGAVLMENAGTGSTRLLLENIPETKGGVVIVSGTGSGRDTAVRTLQNMGMEVTWVKDVTPIPHNGCRPKKRRRG